ncbi:hypothetical protein TRFO_33646 [Tritrichomonas foetus]|uniref:Auto-transporter adhesin head GIN domain-containing protein n=1 Tax=Tritrichomonas foetus TaxID=1144522 RepID=A0A1J4JQM8_9EUKA|nr:hypothetical protein TRFO_33646 [Tritrichomonas foetus]|eukprot:OHS99819.1 hypothetical protein TRFO_33646 [Tritrichomonas foetus]
MLLLIFTSLVLSIAKVRETDGTQAALDKIKELQNMEQKDLNLPLQGSEKIDISGQNVKGSARQLTLEVTATSLAIIDLSITQGNIVLRGPIIATISNSQSSITIEGDAKTKQFPVVFAKGTQINMNVRTTGRSSEDYWVAVGSVSGLQSNLKYDGLTGKEFTSTDSGVYAGLENVKFSQMGHDSFTIVNIPKTTDENPDENPDDETLSPDVIKATTELVSKMVALSKSTTTKITIPESLTVSEDISGKNTLISGKGQALKVNLEASKLSSSSIELGSGTVNLKGPIVAAIRISGETTVTLEFDGKSKTSPYVEIFGSGKVNLKIVASSKPSSSYSFCAGIIRLSNYQLSADMSYHAAKSNDVGYMVGYGDINYELMDQLTNNQAKTLASYDDLIITNKLIVCEAKKDIMPIIIGVVVAVVVVIIIIIVVVVVVKIMKKKKKSSSSHK